MRISSSQSWTTSLYNLMNAQARQSDANAVYSTQRKASDLKGFGHESESINAYQSTLETTKSYLKVNQLVENRLSTQDLALTTTTDAANAAHEAIMTALAGDDGQNLLLTLEGTLDAALNGLNMKHNGGFLFSGGCDDTAPVSVSSLSELAALPQLSDAFENGTVKKASKLDNYTTIETGMLASDVGTSLLQAYRDLKTFANANGGFATPLTDTQKTALTAFATQFKSAHEDLVNSTAINGGRINQAEAIKSSLEGQSNMIQGLISDHVDANMFEAYSAMQKAQTAVQASAQVISTLNQNTLLNLLR